MCWLPPQRHAGSKTLHQQNPPVLDWRYWLTQDDVYNGWKTVVVVYGRLRAHHTTIITGLFPSVHIQTGKEMFSISDEK